jgi:hypothetical protein
MYWREYSGDTLALDTLFDHHRLGAYDLVADEIGCAAAAVHDHETVSVLGQTRIRRALV